MTGSLILLVDENNTPMRGGTMDEAQLGGIWHRVVRVMVEDETGRVLLQRRREDDFYMAGRWDNSSSGHVDADDGSDLEAARRELREELGIALDLEEIGYYKSSRIDGARTYNRFNCLFRAVVSSDAKIVFDPAELAGVLWVSLPWLRKNIQDNPESYTPALIDIINRYYEDYSN